MKRYINRLFIALGAAAMIGGTGCIEETFPSSSATPDQIKGSSTSLQYMTNSLPAFLITWDTYGTSNNTQDWGYPCQMYMRETLGEDFPMYDNSYNYWTYLENGTSLQWVFYYPWTYYYHLIKNANNVIAQATEAAATSESARHSLGQGYGYRALGYLDVARLYEYRATGVSELDAEAKTTVWGLTVPIVKETTTKAEFSNNPSAPFYTMYRFIMDDLNHAEEYLSDYSRTNIAFMDKYTIYGLKVRLWLDMATRFDKDADALAQQKTAEGSNDGYADLGIFSANDCYAKAAEYAQKIISSSHTPLTEAQWSDPNTGFNTEQASWLFGASTTTEEQVNTNYWNTFLGEMSAEASWSMTKYNAYRCIGKSLFDQISTKDWRRNSWIAPDDVGKTTIPSNYKTNLDGDGFAKLPPYSNLKFRPGSGSISVLKTGLIADLPLMRVEEIYFDYFEALAHTQSVSVAAAALQDFVNTYRYTDGSYTCTATNMDDFITALMLQRRIEFWGEGINMFDYKRLAIAVTRRYTGSNYESTLQLNSIKGYVAPWMNYMIPESEADQNSGVVLGPNASGKITTED